MPDHPIYIPLLPKEAQAVIGVPHEQSRGAVKNLQGEGFRFSDMVDIFDAGPVMICERDNIRSIKQSRRKRIAGTSSTPINSPQFMMGTTGLDFRASKGSIEEQSEAIRITEDCAAALRVQAGDELRFVELRPVP